MKQATVSQAEYSAVVYHGTPQTYGIECEDGSIVEGIQSWEAAEALCLLLNLGHMIIDHAGDLVFVTEPDNIPAHLEEPANDDGPEEEADGVEITKDVHDPLLCVFCDKEIMQGQSYGMLKGEFYHGDCLLVKEQPVLCAAPKFGG